jgi:excisionase family DNA binding protein
VTAEALRVTQAARRLGITTRQLLELVQSRKIRFVMINGIAHIPADALVEYESKAS